MKTKSLTKVTLLSIFLVSVITAVTLNSCQKESVKPKIINSNTASQATTSNIDATTNLLLGDANNIAFALQGNEKGLVPKGYDSSSCLVITADTAHKPYTIIYNYGSNCVGSDGNVRSGIVSVTYASTDIRVVNNSITQSFQNYSIGNTTYNGQLSITNTGPNGNGNHVLAESGNFTTLIQGETDSIHINYNYEWLAGEFSSPASNWQFSITGGITGSSSNGKTLNVTVTSALIKNAKNPGCNYYISGTKQTTEGNHPVEYMDYSNPGGCSGEVAVTQNGVTTIQRQ